MGFTTPERVLREEAPETPEIRSGGAAWFRVPWQGDSGKCLSALSCRFFIKGHVI